MMDDLHEIARRLVAFDTVSSRSDAEAMEYLANRLDRPGIRVALQRFRCDGVEAVNLVASLGPPEPDGLVLAGHVDTVPFEGQPGWTHDPLALEADGDRLYGRGTADMKAFIAQCVVAALALDVRRLARPLVLAFTAGEEVGSIGARALAPALPALLGGVPTPRLGWIGEPTSWDVCHAHKGIVTFDLVVRGSGGHASRPEQGVNAIVVASRVVAEIARCQRELRAAGGDPVTFPDSPHPTLNVGTIRGGTATNTIAEECRIEVSYRPLPGTDPRAIHAAIARRLAALDLRDEGGSAARATVAVGEPTVVALLEVLGPRRVAGAPFATDGPDLAAAGIASLVCGPGDLAQAHRVNESIDRHVFERGPDVVRAVVDRLCTGELDG